MQLSENQGEMLHGKPIIIIIIIIIIIVVVVSCLIAQAQCLTNWGDWSIYIYIYVKFIDNGLSYY